ncbi:MAG: nitroreductase [Hyphomicrobiaceae bacterium]
MTNPTLELLLKRRSAKAALLTNPGPTPAELETILTCAARVPDHKKLVPWRFIVFEGEARAQFGEVLARALVAEEKEAPSAVRLEAERGRLMRAPMVVCVVSRVVPNPGAPEIEQILSCGAAAFNLCLAANALGYGTCWITEWYSFSKTVASALGLAANERVAGFIYIGTDSAPQEDRERPVLADIVTRWQP